MIKAEAQITIYDVNDGSRGPTGVGVKSYIRYYKIASSTATPSFDSTWTVTEPPYDGKSTNSLYFTDKVVYTDGNVSWSPVSKLSSYEAAKQANNKADNVDKNLNALNKDVVANKEENLIWRTTFESDFQKENDRIYTAVEEVRQGTADGIAVTNSKISKLEQTSDAFQVSINSTNTKVGELENEMSKQRSYMTFNEKGLTIGSSDSPIKAVHTSSALNFEEESGLVVGSFSSEGLKTAQARIETQLIIGKWAIVLNKNGGLDFRWIGGK